MKEILLVLEEKKGWIMARCIKFERIKCSMAWYYVKQYWVDQISVVYMVWYVSRPSCPSLSGLVPVCLGHPLSYWNPDLKNDSQSLIYGRCFDGSSITALIFQFFLLAFHFVMSLVVYIILYLFLSG